MAACARGTPGCCVAAPPACHVARMQRFTSHAARARAGTVIATPREMSIEISMEKTAHPVGLVAVMLCVLGPTLAPLRAQGPPQGGVVRISRTHTPPAIEDFVAGDPPESTLTVTEFRQFEPGDGVPASDATTAYVSYDDANLYVVFVCRSAPRLVRAGLTKREDILADDGVAVYLDTFHDRTHAYRFQTNPL